jgi:PAS domain S-box-containing protein
MLYLISDLMYVSGYRDLENQSVVQNTGRVSDALAAKEEALGTFCYDWAAWDDTYQFAQDKNATYIEKNLTNQQSFDQVSLNLFLIIDTNHQVVFGRVVDQSGVNEMPLPAEFVDFLARSWMTIDNNSENKTGIAVLDGVPIIIAANPILTSEATGPSVGTLILGRFIDGDTISNLAKTTNLAITLLPINFPKFPTDVGAVIKAADNANTAIVQVVNKNIIQGFRVVDDLYRQPAFVFRIDMPRQIYMQGQKTLTYLHLSLLLMSFGFFFVFLFVVNKTILNRMTTLSVGLNTIAQEGNVSKRVSVPGSDELSGLAGNINEMLESIEKSHAEIRSQKEFIDSILTNTPNAVLVVDKNQTIVMANNAFSSMFGLIKDSVKGQILSGIAILNDLSFEAKKFIDSNAPDGNTELQVRGNGLRKTLTVSFTRMNEDALFLIIFTDITTEMDRQDRLYLTDRLASVGEMASGIAHELNNPLFSIVGLSELLTEEADVPDSIRDDVVTINAEARRAAAVVKNMLSFARKHVAAKQSVQINQVIDDVLKLRSYHWKVNNITVETHLDPELPNVMADYFQMQQVFLNIILNAEQSMVESHGRGTLKITSERVDNTIKLTFADDGSGIAPQNLSRIFDPFFTTKEVGSGTGLGLSICFGIVTSHGGQVHVKSEVGHGATFTVELPVK